MANPIKCVYFCYFQYHKGPEIVAQYPPEYPFKSILSFMSPEVFNATSDYLIPRSELCWRIVSVYILM